MKRLRKRKPSPRCKPSPYPTAVIELARAFQAGEDCGAGLHDTLLEAGHPGPAQHFAGDGACRPGGTCLAVATILDPRPEDPDDPTAEWSTDPKSKPVRKSWGGDDQDLSPDFLAVCLRLESFGIARVEVTYDGNGDSGTVESITFRDRDGNEVGPSGSAKGKKASSRPVRGPEVDLADKIDEVVCDILPGGWEINEGSFGTVTLNTLTRRIYIGHSWRIESTNEEAFELDL